MRINEYEQQAATTATYAIGSPYPFLGLLEEIGEVASVLAKADRDNAGVLDATRRAQLRKELGDVAWMAAAVARAAGTTLHTEEQPAFSYKRQLLLTYAPADAARILLADCARIASDFLAVPVKDMRPDFLRALLRQLLAAWENLCLTFGFQPEAVAAENLRKLADRKQRNVIHGSGDDR